jgi:hypothetical protein
MKKRNKFVAVPKKNNSEYKTISVRVTNTEKEYIEKWCFDNQTDISSLIRQALKDKIQL